MKAYFGLRLRCSWLRLGFYFKFTPVFFHLMIFTSIKEINTLLSKVINRLRKEINMSLSKRMSSFYLKVTNGLVTHI